MSETPSTPTKFLIRDDYEQRGCFSWSKPKFMRLCAKLNETPAELAERIGIRSPSILVRKFRQGFTNSEGILLTFFDETLHALKTATPSHD